MSEKQPTKQLTIRKFSEEEYAALKALADSQDESLENWAYLYLKQALSQPVVRKRYVLRAFDQENGASVVIRRVENDMNHDVNRFLSEQQQQAFQIAIEFVKRNGPGDREEAMKALNATFKVAFETLM